MTQGYINHVELILDASTSMAGHAADLVKVADAQIAYLAGKSKAEDQETRVTVCTFSDPQYHDGLTAKCLIYDKDVLRMPSIAGLYHPYGNTALCDAVITGVEDMQLTPQKYGDHAFWLLLLTDGLEHRSTEAGKKKLPGMLSSLPGNWTLAAFVPHILAKKEMLRLGFPAENVSVWDAAQTGSLTEVGEVIRQATDTYMANRASGLRSTSNLFAPSASAIKAALVPLTQGSYYFEQVSADDYPAGVRIDEFVTSRTGKPYAPGSAYYQMMKRERIQPYKKIAVQIGADIFMGPAARQQLGLPEDHEVRVSPGNWKGYAVFIMSSSFNRRLLGGTRLLLIR